MISFIKIKIPLRTTGNVKLKVKPKCKEMQEQGISCHNKNRNGENKKGKKDHR